MAKRARKASIKRIGYLNKKTPVSQNTESVDDNWEDEYIARFSKEPDRVLSYAEILEVLERSKASLDAAAQKAGLR